MDKKPVKVVKKKSDDLSTVKNLLMEIRDELIIERKDKLRNSLVLATAIVMFAVPLNFMVEVSANYISSSVGSEVDFFAYDTFYFWLFVFSIIFVLVAFTTFFFPMTEIFMDNFDWDTAFKDLEETGKDYDDYYKDPDSSIECKICDETFESYRGWDRHKDDCRTENLDKWQKWEKENEKMSKV